MMEIRTLSNEVLARLEASTLEGADFSSATMREADFADAHLHEVNFNHANLEQAQFRHADLTAADLTHADLRHACLDQANLAHADLSYALLAPASLRQANLRGACLAYCDLHGAQVEGAEYDDETRWPEGYDPAVHGAVKSAASAAGAAAASAQAEQLVRAGNVPGALDVLVAAVLAEPSNVTLHRRLARVYLLAHEADLAVQHLQRALQLNANDAGTHFELGRVFAGLGLYSMALSHLAESERLAPSEKTDRCLAEVRGRAKHAPGLRA